MQDIIISSKRIKKELKVFLLCFAIAFCTNIISIIAFKTPWVEVFTQIGYVIIISATLYLISAIFRLIAHGVRHLIKNRP